MLADCGDSSPVGLHIATVFRPKTNNGNNNNERSSEEIHTLNRTITINKDGLGNRQVRVEYLDADGEHSPVIDEIHGEGDKVPVRFEYHGKTITLRVYYDDVLKLELKDFDPQKQKRKRISGSGGNG